MEKMGNIFHISQWEGLFPYSMEKCSKMFQTTNQSCSDIQDIQGTCNSAADR